MEFPSPLGTDRLNQSFNHYAVILSPPQKHIIAGIISPADPLFLGKHPCDPLPPAAIVAEKSRALPAARVTSISQHDKTFTPTRVRVKRGERLWLSAESGQGAHVAFSVSRPAAEVARGVLARLRNRVNALLHDGWRTV